MSVTYNQARTILFGLSTLSFITSLLLVTLIPDAPSVDDNNSYQLQQQQQQQQYDPIIIQHLQNEQERVLLTNNNNNNNNNNYQQQQRITIRQRRERQHEQEYLPKELYDIMSRQQQHEQEIDRNHPNRVLQQQQQLQLPNPIQQEQHEKITVQQEAQQQLPPPTQQQQQQQHVQQQNPLQIQQQTNSKNNNENGASAFQQQNHYTSSTFDGDGSNNNNINIHRYQPLVISDNKIVAGTDPIELLRRKEEEHKQQQQYEQHRDNEYDEFVSGNANNNNDNNNVVVLVPNRKKTKIHFSRDNISVPVAVQVPMIQNQYDESNRYGGIDKRQLLVSHNTNNANEITQQQSTPQQQHFTFQHIEKIDNNMHPEQSAIVQEHYNEQQQQQHQKEESSNHHFTFQHIENNHNNNIDNSKNQQANANIQQEQETHRFTFQHLESNPGKVTHQIPNPIQPVQENHFAFQHIGEIDLKKQQSTTTGATTSRRDIIDSIVRHVIGSGGDVDNNQQYLHKTSTTGDDKTTQKNGDRKSITTSSSASSFGYVTVNSTEQLHTILKDYYSQQQQRKQQQQQQILSMKGGSSSSRNSYVKTPDLFVLVADPNTNSDWLLNNLNRHEHICCSTNIDTSMENIQEQEQQQYTIIDYSNMILVGGFPLNGLNPNNDSTKSSAAVHNDNDTTISISTSCTVQFVIDQIDKMKHHLAMNKDNKSVPRACVEINSANPLYSNNILQRLCNFITNRLNGNYTKEYIVSSFVQSFVSLPLYNPTNSASLVQQQQLEFGCVCTDQTTTRGLHIVTEWTSTYLESLLSTSPMRGSKVIRLTKRNHIFTYLLQLVSNETNVARAIPSSSSSSSSSIDITKHIRWLQQSDKKFFVNVHNMIGTLKSMKDSERISDELAWTYSSEILFIDYQDFHNSYTIENTIQRIFHFLDVDVQHTSNAYHTLITSASSQFVQDAELINTIVSNLIVNREVVTEIIIASGYGHFLHNEAGRIVTSQQQQQQQQQQYPIQHIVYSTNNDNENKLQQQYHRRWDTQIGINTTYLSTDLLFDDSKYTTLVHALQSFPPDMLVVISNSNVDVSISNHIRSVTNMYESLANFRTTLTKFIEHGAVVIAADSRCCSPALTHVKPGDYFSSIGHRTRRSCSTNSAKNNDCIWAGDDFALPWQLFMKQLALERTTPGTLSNNNVYLDSTLIGGRANDIIRLLQDVDVFHTEDEQAVFTDFMYHDKNRIVLDYNQQVFGKIFEGVTDKVTMHRGCVGGGETIFVDEQDTELSGHNKLPLLLSIRKDLQCSGISTTGNSSNNVTTFPIWDITMGIKIQPILDHIDRLFIQGICLSGMSNSHNSELLFIMDNEMIMASHPRQELTTGRLSILNKLFVHAHKILKNSNSKERWNSLTSTLLSGGFPMWVWDGVYKGCNKNNFGEESIPLFTSTASVGCKYTFPIPSIDLITMSKIENDDWYDSFQKSDTDYPYNSKLRKVIWRGSLIGIDDSVLYDSVQWKLSKTLHEHNYDFVSTGIDEVPHHLHSMDFIPIGGLKGKPQSRNQMQKYMAIIDVGASATNDTLASTLCMNSVTILIESNILHYYHYDIKPWKHYIPVKEDLSDLIDHIVFALNPKNGPIIKDIISSANQFCSERFVLNQISYDLLDTLESYVHLLDIYDASWKSKWQIKKNTILNSRLYNLDEII